jgi:hypothetical protein
MKMITCNARREHASTKRGAMRKLIALGLVASVAALALSTLPAGATVSGTNGTVVGGASKRGGPYKGAPQTFRNFRSQHPGWNPGQRPKGDIRPEPVAPASRF